MRCAVGKLLARPGKYDWIDSYSVSNERRAGCPRFSTHSLPTSFEQQNLIHSNAQSGFLEYVGMNRPRPPMIGRWPLSGVVPAGTMSTALSVPGAAYGISASKVSSAITPASTFSVGGSL